MVSAILIERVKNSGDKIDRLAGASGISMLNRWEMSLLAMPTLSDVEAASIRRQTSCVEVDAILLDLRNSSLRENDTKLLSVNHLRDLAYAMHEMADHEVLARKGR